MKYLDLKLRRDLRKNWQQFFSVFLMSLLSVLIFVGLQGAWHGLEKSLDSFISSSNVPDIWVQTTNLTDYEVDQIKSLDGVKSVVPETRITTEIDSKSNSDKYLILDSFSTSSQQIANVTEGAKFSSTVDNGIWINKEYAVSNNLSVGDNLKITLAGKTANVKILGFVQSADRIYFTGSLEYIAPNYNNYAYGYISKNTMDKLLGTQVPSNLVEIYSSNADIRDEIEDILGNKLVTYYNQKTLTDVSEATDRVGQIRNLSYLFSFIFILLAILAMFTTIRRLIESQTKEIAVIKALGYSNSQVTRHYISFGLLVGTIGAVLGAIVSPAMSWFVLETQKTMFSLPNWQIAYSWSSLLVIILVILICSLSAYFASRKAIKGLPAVFLRGKSKEVKHVSIERISFLWNKFSDETKWAVRDAFINRVRVLMGIIGVSGSMMLLIAGIGMPISMNHLVDKAYNEDFSYSKRLTVSDYELADKTYDGQWVQISQAHFSKDDGYNRLLIVISQGNFVNATTSKGEAIKEGGLYVTNGFAEAANIKVGDKMKVIPYHDGKEYTFKVKGIVTSETNQGAYIMSSTFEKAGGAFNPSTLLVGDNISSRQLSNDSNVQSVIKKNNQERNAYDFVNSLMSVFLMIIGFALLLVVVVLYNLGSLNFVERTRDYATLQVLGFSKRNLQNITMIENLITTSVGWMIGIPMGIWFLRQYVATFSTIRIEYTAYVTWQVLLLASLLVWLTSLLTTVVISRRIKKIDMVEALKGVE
ncbi:ABC transporter permease [Streptococcus salivarius]|uniref:Putative permease protein n=1 Tax=Streptococcus salivarius TaxID=1304 RepID=A0A1R3T6S0_STRSL|nr:FtsX-like permease family protein [Streptococcus salivarius]SCW20991.1 Putative permease protein [Streptococcus salivarius]